MINTTKRTIAIRIIAQVQSLNPPGRFLIEDTNASLVDISVSAKCSMGSISGSSGGGGGAGANSSSSTTTGGKIIHPTVMKKVWIIADNEKAIEKVMHRLREREKKKNTGGDDDKKKQLQQRPNKKGGDGKKRVANNGNVKSSPSVEKEQQNVVLAPNLNLASNHIAIDMGQQQQNMVASNLLHVKVNNNSTTAIMPVAAGEGMNETSYNFLQYSGDGIVDSSSSMDMKLPAINKEAVVVARMAATGTSITSNQVAGGSDATKQLLDYPLRQWIEKKNREEISSPAEYMKEALTIALKLTEFIIQAEKVEQVGWGNVPVSLESIDAINVHVLASQNQVGGNEAVELVWMSSPAGENPIAGTVSARLFAMGMILYELFSGERMPLMADVPMLSASSKSMGGIALTSDNESSCSSGSNHHRPQKRYQTHMAPAGDMLSNCIANLEWKGLPWPVRFLVKNLLDCGKGNNCGDDAYSSLIELNQDLSLMLANPPRFVDNIRVNTSLPTSLDICDKLYGRELEMAKLDTLYQQYIKENVFKGVIISGGAGVGKSRLAMYTQLLTSWCNGYFCASKFEQNQMNARPLATIGTVFNTLCDLYAEGATPDQLALVKKELEIGLGSQAGLLAGVVTSLTRLLPSCARVESPSNCINVSYSMRHLLGELLRVISSHSRWPITLLIEDIQFADSASLLLIGYMLFSRPPIFIVFSHRDDEDGQNKTFQNWLESLSMFNLESLRLGNISVDSVNSLVSETLHVTPRITRPLSDVLYQKTRGNPLFLRQLFVSLYGQGHIYFDLSKPRWAWDLNKIEQQPITSSVLSLLMKEIQQLDHNLQLGLGVASCLGSCARSDILNLLSQGLGVDLIDILQRVSQKGFMNNVNNGAMFRFAHDKIQQAGT